MNKQFKEDLLTKEISRRKSHKIRPFLQFFLTFFANTFQTEILKTLPFLRFFSSVIARDSEKGQHNKGSKKFMYFNLKYMNIPVRPNMKILILWQKKKIPRTVTFYFILPIYFGGPN